MYNVLIVYERFFLNQFFINWKTKERILLKGVIGRLHLLTLISILSCKN